MRQLAYMLLAGTMLVASCKGNDGEIGPQGTQGDQGIQGIQGPAGLSGLEKSGFIKGTLKGTRTDGTAFNESFENTIRSYAEGFSSERGYHTLDLHRMGETERNNRIWMELRVLNKGTSNQEVKITSFDVVYAKALANNQAFSVDATATFHDFSITYPVAPSNTAYDFAFDFSTYGGDVQSQYLSTPESYYYGFKNTSGDVVYFQSPSWSTNYQGAFAFVIKGDGTKVTTSTKYGNLKLSYNDNDDYIMLNAQGTDLSSTVTVPADTYTISNYKYDNATGVLTFDYTMNIGGVARDNSSEHPLTVSGSVETKAYDLVLNSANPGTGL